MIEEPLDETRRIVGNELVDDGFRQPLFRHLRGAYRSGRAENRELLAVDALDQRDHGEKLADARAVNPHQWAARAGNAAFSVTFVYSRRMFLAPLQAMRQQRRRERRRRR